ISVHNAINDALTPHAIEAILEGHIRSYFQHAKEADLLTTFKNLIKGEDHDYFIIALRLESALLEGQGLGILPATSGYHTFLARLAQDRHMIESEAQRLERAYGIKIPRNAQLMHNQIDKTKQQAQLLIQRINAL
ncbi:MAG TPA: hypothetical protein VI522_00910, partial [Gammaproteobacteria bacterium]|nr:hypothetical protein [Gammaproteobacteria bacterium]